MVPSPKLPKLDKSNTGTMFDAYVYRTNTWRICKKKYKIIVSPICAARRAFFIFFGEDMPETRKRSSNADAASL